MFLEGDGCKSSLDYRGARLVSQLPRGMGSDMWLHRRLMKGISKTASTWLRMRVGASRCSQVRPPCDEAALLEHLGQFAFRLFKRTDLPEDPKRPRLKPIFLAHLHKR